jgi:hypothetical protein
VSEVNGREEKEKILISHRAAGHTKFLFDRINLINMIRNPERF